jgi:hypothetical protein
MSGHGRMPYLVLTLALLSARNTKAQTPLGGDLVVAAFPTGALAEYSPQPVCDDSGVCGLFWSDNHAAPDTNKIDILAAAVSAEGQVLAQPRVLATGDFPNGPAVAGLEQGFAVLWDNQFPDGHTSPLLQYYDESLVPQGDPITLPFVRDTGGFDNPSSYSAFFEIVRTPLGFALAAGAIDAPATSGVFVFFIGRDGSVLRPRQRLNDDITSEVGFGAANPLTMQPTGELVATYTLFGSGSANAIYLRRLAADGTILGPEELVSTENVPQSRSVVASGPDGSFLVVWYKSEAPDTTNVILARRFATDGRPLGDVFQINNVLELDQRYPVIAADIQGNYFIAWQSFDASAPDLSWEIHGRLFRPDGTPVSGEIRLNQERQFEQELPRVAFAPNGTLVLGWQSSSNRQIRDEGPVPVVRRFSASPGQEICALTGAHVACDLARTGGEMELQLVRDGRPAAVTLFGDWDGDGRDDVCSYDHERFRCDVNHEGQSTAFERFGEPGDVPLLADIDGDGRADPCVWRVGQLLCDTAHDGKVHFQRRFGPNNGVPLLGNLDGDHKADLCVVSNGHWDCLTQAGQRLHFELGKRGDSFALGDADRDGRADPCFLRKGVLMCNTAHDGGSPNYTLHLDVAAGARLLFGNLDGL